MPPLVLHTPGWRVWLARHNGVPAGACYTYDDGTTAGVYWLATLPEHRSRGIGRAVMSTALATHPHRPAVLAATTAGRPLYTALGFTAVSTMAWHWSRT